MQKEKEKSSKPSEEKDKEDKSSADKDKEEKKDDKKDDKKKDKKEDKEEKDDKKEDKKEKEKEEREKKREERRREREKELKTYTENPFLLLCCVYFDTTHVGYMYDKDLEDLLLTLGLSLSRSQVGCQFLLCLIITLGTEKFY